MSTLIEVKWANDKLHTLYDSATAIFTGATNGIGLATVRSFAQRISRPTALIAGRSRRSFEHELKLLQELNPNGEFTFIEADLSLIESVDDVCAQIKDRLPSHSVDFVCMSQGYAPIEGRRFTPEGMDESLTLAYYGRVRMAQNLIRNGVVKPKVRFLSVLLGAREGKVFEDDLALESNYSIMNMRGHFGSLMTLSFDTLAMQNPLMAFVHVYPGAVDTGLLARGVSNWFLWMLMYVFERVLMLRAMTPEESGERTLDMVTGDGFAKGCWSVDWVGVQSESRWLERYREGEKMRDRIWESNERMFEKALAS